LGSVQHQDHHPVARADPSATQGAGERRDAAAKPGPGDGVAQKPQRRSAWLHQCMPFELVDPILSSRQIRLLGGPDIRAVVALMGSVAGQLRGQLAASLLVANWCLELIFDKT